MKGKEGKQEPSQGASAIIYKRGDDGWGQSDEWSGEKGPDPGYMLTVEPGQIVDRVDLEYISYFVRGNSLVYACEIIIK